MPLFASLPLAQEAQRSQHFPQKVARLSQIPLLPQTKRGKTPHLAEPFLLQGMPLFASLPLAQEAQSSQYFPPKVARLSQIPLSPQTKRGKTPHLAEPLLLQGMPLFASLPLAQEAQRSQHFPQKVA